MDGPRTKAKKLFDIFSPQTLIHTDHITLASYIYVCMCYIYVVTLILVVCNSMTGVVTCETASDSDNMFEIVSSTEGTEHKMHTRELIASNPNPDQKPPHPSSCALIL